MYNFRRSTLVQISYCDQISNFEKRLSKHYENIDTIPDTDIQQMIIELDVVSQRCPTMSQECQRLVQKCKTLLAKLSITAPQYASSYGWMSPIAAQLDDIKEVDQSHSPNQSQSIFTGCDNQWLQFMMDSFIRDDNLCEPQTLPADDSLMVFHLSQQTNNNTNPNLSSIIKNSQEPSSEKIPVTPQDQTITSSPCIRLSQPQQLVVLSHSDILTLANHLKLNPSDLTVAIEKLRPKTIQPVEIEYININENQIDLTSNVQRMSSSEGSAVSATPPSQLR